MRQPDPKTSQDRHLSPWVLGTLGLLLLGLALLTAPSASASYEQVADFGKDELARATGLAVNVSGAGGVSPGSVYAVSSGSQRVARYTAEGEFREAWGWGVGNGAAEYQRCGPDGEAAYPTCKPPFEALPRGEGPGQLLSPVGVAVEQSTGRVYVLDDERKSGVVQVFSADGTEILGSFGERGVFGESFDEGPGKIHRPRPAGIAVRNGAVVYLTDWKAPSAASPFEDRVMVFENGVYTGREKDIAASPPAPAHKYAPFGIAVDNANNLYTMGEDAIFEFSPADRLNPICEYDFSAGGLQSMTVDPVSGAPFFFSSKGKKEIHELSPCNSEGEFEEVGTIAVSPQTTELSALAFNPILSYEEEGRPPGVLYGADAVERPGEKGIGHIFAQPVSLVPSIESQSVSGVGESSALLEAEINPNGEATTYVFQYLSEAAYEANEPGDRFAGASEVPVGGASLGAGVATLPVSVPVSGLAPGTSYRFRAVATNVEGTTEGEAESFLTYPITSSGLPNGRAYELVTPAEKHGGEPFPLNPETGSCGFECKPGVLSEAFPRQISSDGEAIVYSGFAFSTEEGASVYNEYLSKRTSSGWQTKNLSPALMGSSAQGYKAFDAELSEGVLYQINPTLSPSAPPGFANLYRQPSANPAALEPLLASAPPNRPEGGLSIAYAGASADFSHHFFAANDALEGSVPAGIDGGASKRNLYEYDGETLRLVNVLPDESTIPGAFFGADNQAEGETSNLAHAISEDGSRAFWSDESGQVYVREDGTSTEEVPDASGKFLAASEDGSKLLLTNGLLYDVENLSAPPIDLTEGEGGFVGITGQSEDLSKLYFVDTVVLDGAPNSQGAVAQAGKPNLYAWQEGGTARYVATLLPADTPGATSRSGTWTASPANRLAQASPDGRWLAFLSKAALIDGFENVGPCAQKQGSNPPVFVTSACNEVYLYNSASEELLCPSCNPSGEAPHGPSTLPLLIPGRIGAEEAQPQSRYLSNAGRLYFDSQDALSARDTNGNVEDAYQYEPQGVGDCKLEEGCVSLISAGREPHDSNFLAADEENVFFTTRDQLLLEDRDKLLDVYVAREGGGFPTVAQSGGGECQGEACQPSPIVPAYPTPASGFTGAGNLKQGGPTNKRCPKPKRKVRRKGKTRCVPANRKRQGKKAQARHNQGGGR